MSEGLLRDSGDTGPGPAPMNNLPVDIYKLHANAIVSVDSPSFIKFFSRLALLWQSVLGFLYSLSTFRCKARRKLNHEIITGKRSEHKYFII